LRTSAISGPARTLARVGEHEDVAVDGGDAGVERQRLSAGGSSISGPRAERASARAGRRSIRRRRR
jgi:hypothetical protein